MSDANVASMSDSPHSVEHTDRTRVFGVVYTHLKFVGGGDLYVTEYGLPFVENLKPDNFLTDKDWFSKNSVKLLGTGTLYKVRTKEINGRSKDIVVKWNRMGQEIPGAEDAEELTTAEFNTPFEELSLVMELRDSKYESDGMIMTQKPLAIYESPDHVELSRSGRKEYKMHAKIQTHKEIKLSMFRLYAVIYEWIDGIDAAEAFGKGMLEKEQVESFTFRARDELKRKGFVVRDNKPHHIIVRPKESTGLAKDRKGETLYAGGQVMA